MNNAIPNSTMNIIRPQAMKATRPMLISGGLPTLPGYVFKLNQLLACADPNMDAVAQVVRTDASLPAQLLRLANLYLLDTEEPIRTVAEAVVTVGAQRLRTLVITCPLLDCAGDIRRWSSLQSFWQHNFMSAVLSEEIATWLEYERPDVAYAAGLLRDIGELSLIAQSRQDGTQWPQKEPGSRSFRVRSREAGRRLAIACKLTPELVEVCGCGDDPALAWHDPMLVKIVISAGKFCAASGLVSGGSPQQLLSDENQTGVDSMLAETLGLSPQRAGMLGDILRRRFRDRLPDLEFSRTGLLNGALPKHEARKSEEAQMLAIA